MAKALIIIDMLKGYFEQIYNPKEILKNQLDLIREFNDAGLQVIIVKGKDREQPNPVMERLWGDEFAGEPEKFELIEELKDVKQDLLLEKTEYSAFFRTGLDEFCEKNNITEMYFCGVFSGVCVYFSAVDAAYRKIQPYLVTDASSTSQKKWHVVNCDRFSEVIGPTISTKEVIINLK